MKTNARYAFVLTLTLGPLGGCGDDSNDADDSAGTGSTSVAMSSSTGGDPAATTESASSSTSDGGSGNADESSSGGEDPFADCSVDVLAEDFGVVDAMGVPGPPRWAGPGADENGELIDDGKSDYVVSVTYLALSLDADLEFFGQLNAGNAAALYSNPGMVASQLGGSAQCGSARTFTVWESEEAMMEFVSSDAHLQSVSAFPSLSRGGSTLSVWPDRATVSEITWDVALERLSTAEAYD